MGNNNSFGDPRDYRVRENTTIPGVEIKEITTTHAPADIIKWFSPPVDVQSTITWGSSQLAPEPIKINYIGPVICLNTYKLTKTYGIRFIVSHMTLIDPNIKMTIFSLDSGDLIPLELDNLNIKTENIERLGDFLSGFDLSQNADTISFCGRNHSGNGLFKLRKI